MLRLKQRKHRFSLFKSKRDLATALNDALPADDTRYIAITRGGFSSITVICYIAEHTRIRALHASTLRLGEKQALAMLKLQRDGRLGTVDLIVGGLQQRTDRARGYNYLQRIEEATGDNAWTIRVERNHSKVILMDTDDGKFVVETSSNLNTNPHVEEFGIEKSAEAYDYYLDALFGADDAGDDVSDNIRSGAETT